METVPTATAATAEDFSSSSSSTSPTAAISRWKYNVSRRYQHLLDKSVPHVLHRWVVCLAVVSIYAVRVYLVQGFYIITYGLGIYLLNLLMGFLSPQIDPEYSDGPTLPTRGSDEFRPFVRRLPEFKFCLTRTIRMMRNSLAIGINRFNCVSLSYNVIDQLFYANVIGWSNTLLKLFWFSHGRYCVTRSFCIGFVLTFFSAFDVPVFWPILLFYWLMLFTLTMRRQIMHMIKYRYVPFSLGKQRYDGKRPSSSDATSSED